jgi:hypothetical protein
VAEVVAQDKMVQAAQVVVPTVLLTMYLHQQQRILEPVAAETMLRTMLQVQVGQE